MDGFAIIDAPRSGAENMAIDRLALEFAQQTEQVVLRLYRWANPTVSLGYFQKYVDYKAHPVSAAAEVVRRATGGGAIVHHHDWTYSVAVPNQLLPAITGIGPSQLVYDCLHDAVVKWTKHSTGLPAEKWSSGDAQGCSLPETSAGCDFLCFHRRSSGDVVVGDAKVLGSAQRRGRSAIVQHGSLLLNRSPFEPSLPGLVQLANTKNDDLQAAFSAAGQRSYLESLKLALEERLKITLAEADNLSTVLNVDEADISRFRSPAWTQRV